jgi:hypothetical protein
MSVKYLIEVVIVTYSVDLQRCVDLINSMRDQQFIDKNIQINVVVNDTVEITEKFSSLTQEITNIKIFNGTDFGIESHTNNDWYTQQWIKVAIARNIKTPWYVIVDSDQQLHQDYDVELTDWYYNNRAFYKTISLSELATGNPRFVEYYTNAARFWNVDIDKHADILLSEIPPVIMHTESVQNMLNHCNKSLILEGHVHEFGLYWTYLIKENLVEKLYSPIENIVCKKHQLIHKRI